jgi:hypothetical protein
MIAEPLNRRRVLRRVAVVICVAAALVLLSDSLVTRISPRDLTVTAMGETAVRIAIYFENHKELPIAFDQLPTRDGYMNRTIDGWGQPLDYTILDSHTFKLASLGRDGVQGGKADDADIVRTYRMENGTAHQLEEQETNDLSAAQNH